MSSNINLWFAKDENGNIITVNDVDKEYKGKYYCPLCGSEVIPKALDSNMVSPHFAHINREACSGESIFHYWVKNQLIKVDDIFEVVTNEPHQYMCEEILMEQSYETPYGLYRPDATIITYKGEKIFVEINYANKKNVNDYYLKWKHLGNIVIEFNIKNVYDEENNKINITNSFKALYFDGKEFEIDKNCKEYNNLKKSIKNNIKNEDINKIEWFIDDIYKYNIKRTKVCDLACSFLIFMQEFENRRIIESIYRVKKCQNSIKDVIEFIFKDVEEAINSKCKEYNLDIEIIKNDISKNHLVYHRIFGKEVFDIKLSKNSIEKLNEYKKYIKNNFRYEDYKDIMTQNSFRNIINDFRFYGMESTTIRFSIEDIYKETLESFKIKISENIMSTIGSFATKGEEIIKDAKRNLEKIISEKYVDSNMLSNCLVSEFDLENYNLLQKLYLPEKEQLKLSKIMSSEFYNIEGVEIKGILFYRREDVEIEFRKIISIIEKHKSKYEVQLNNCKELSKAFCHIKCTDESIVFYNEYYDKFTIKDNKLMTSGIVVAIIKDDDFADEVIEIINLLKTEECTFGKDILDVYRKIESRYSSVDGNYLIENSIIGMSLYKTDKYGNKICLISYHRYENGSKFDDVINTFSYDLREYLYGGEN